MRLWGSGRDRQADPEGHGSSGKLLHTKLNSTLQRSPTRTRSTSGHLSRQEPNHSGSCVSTSILSSSHKGLQEVCHEECPDVLHWLQVSEVCSWQGCSSWHRTLLGASGMPTRIIIAYSCSGILFYRHGSCQWPSCESSRHHSYATAHRGVQAGGIEEA